MTPPLAVIDPQSGNLTPSDGRRRTLQRALGKADRRLLTDAIQTKGGAEVARAERARTTVDVAVERPFEDTEPAHPAKAEALTEAALARRRQELFDIELRAKTVEAKARRHHEAEQRLAAEIQRHVAFLARLGSAEREAPDQIEAAETLMAALSDAMIALHGFERAPLPPAARQWAMAQQMSRQMADAITAFLARRIQEPRP